MTLPTVLMWCDDTTGTDHVLTDASSTAGVKEVRFSVEVMNAAGSVVAQGYYQVSYDGLTWTSPTPVGVQRESDGVAYGTTFTALSSTRRWVRYGVRLRNSSGSALNTAYVTLRVETKGD